MRITARLDAESEHYIETIRKTIGLKTVTDVLRYSLREAATHLEQEAKPGDRMKVLLGSEYVGSFEGDRALSTNYKQSIEDYLDEKFPQYSEVKK